jgi:hypothetical protein
MHMQNEKELIRLRRELPEPGARHESAQFAILPAARTRTRTLHQGGSILPAVRTTANYPHQALKGWGYFVFVCSCSCLSKNTQARENYSGSIDIDSR